jgi:hypothetical protein
MMFGWVAEKSENARVYMCIKEVKWDLENLTSLRIATILALAQIIREQIIMGAGVPLDVLNSPLDYSRRDLVTFYGVMENIRNAGTMQIDATKKNMRNLGVELPKFAEDHALATKRGIEIWMCTVGAGIVPDRRDEVRLIWSYLSKSFDYLKQAINQILEIEDQTIQMTGGVNSEMFSLIDRDEWIKLCQFVPGSFVKELKLGT